ncbi:unnamed protein product [Protopolystoma xenopodis]|uniref:Uncharacterized protein n=1 Tax=Protopolystoma xenopodis TaxID=117903 RepID=A0A448WNE4_9PLAT|nr:unnamed protein product [Protopolystoma xenopodis]
MASCWMDIVDDLSDSKDPHSFSSDSHSKVQEASNYPSFSGSENSANPTASEQQCPDVKSLAFASPSISATTLVTYQPSLKGNRQVGKTFASSKCLDSSLECSHQSKRRKYQPCLQSKASSLDLCPEFVSSSNNADGLTCREERIVTRTASSLQPIEWSRLPSASSDWVCVLFHLCFFL